MLLWGSSMRLFRTNLVIRGIMKILVEVYFWWINIRRGGWQFLYLWLFWLLLCIKLGRSIRWRRKRIINNIFKILILLRVNLRIKITIRIRIEIWVKVTDIWWENLLRCRNWRFMKINTTIMMIMITIIICAMMMGTVVRIHLIIYVLSKGGNNSLIITKMMRCRMKICMWKKNNLSNNDYEYENT